MKNKEIVEKLKEVERLGRQQRLLIERLMVYPVPLGDVIDLRRMRSEISLILEHLGLDSVKKPAVPERMALVKKPPPPEEKTDD